MDQSLYILYTVLLEKCMLAQIGAHYIFYCTFYTHITLTPIIIPSSLNILLGLELTLPSSLVFHKMSTSKFKFDEDLKV